MITQNALLLDQTEAASRLMESLSKICFAPRLPEPYLVPEGMAIDHEKGIFRRQGDLGNLVQLAEVLKCYLIAAGVSPVRNGVLKIMPRLPEKWSVSMEDFPVQNTDARLSMKVSRPSRCRQTMEWSLTSEEGIEEIFIRFGPFKPGKEKAKVKVNGRRYTIDLETSGDSSWGWLKL